MAAPLLGLASLLGREYAYSRPTYKEQDDILKVLSPQTYYGNQLINYLTNTFGVDSDLSRAQNTIEQSSRAAYDNGPKGISQEEYDRQMADLNALTNRPGGIERFENTLRDMEYGTVNPVDFQYVGPQTEDSVTFQLGEAMLPRRLESVPVESNFTPAQLEALRDRIYGTQEQIGPQQDTVPFVMPGPGGDDMPQGGGGFMPQGGGDFMPQGGGKSLFDVEFEDVQQYLRGGVVGRRRA
jgi:hypothetical protein